jgi:hypothetical protein
MSGMLKSRTRATTFGTETSVTVGNWVGAIVVGLLVLLVQASDDRRRTAPPAGDAAIPEPKRPDPPATKDVEHPSPPKPPAPAVETPAVAPRPPTAAHRPQISPPQQKSEGLPESAQPTPNPAPTPKPAPSSNEPPTEESAKPATGVLDLTSLERRLRDTKAIGVLTKLSLKNQVDDLLGEFREFHQSGDQARLAKLRETFELLILKVLSLLQDGDPALARDVSSSREALWSILVDPDTFKNL